MREESQLDEMRDAIRGDFERLAARRGEQELMRLTEPDAPAEQPELPHEQTEQPEEQAGTSDVEGAPPRRSWLARLFSP